VRPYLVGEAPSRRTEGHPPLSGSSGRRLSETLGSPLEESFELRNLLEHWPGSGGRGSRFDRPAAVLAAISLVTTEHPERVVCLGYRAAGAFLLSRTDVEALGWRSLTVAGHAFELAVVPHPSGVNRWWNEEGNRLAAAEFLRATAAA